MIIQLLLIFLIIIIAVTTESIVGFGTSTISLPIVCMIYPIHQVILFIGIIHFISNIWKLYFFKTRLNWKLILTFGIPAVIASFLGAYSTLQIPDIFVYKILGTILVIYSTFLFFNGQIIPPKSDFFLISGGVVSGFLSGLIGLGGPIRATFLHSMNLQKLTFIFTASFISFFIDASSINNIYHTWYKT